MKRFAAALSLFTRIPVWRWTEIPAQYYSSAVVYWPLTGWVTSGLSAFVLYALSMVMPVYAAAMVAMVARTLLTGALHEDGLADFCDGFGGGRDKEGILAIMKDSHIGTYGVIGLLSYYLAVILLVGSLPPLMAAATLLASGPFARLCASQLTNRLPYARPEGAKNRVSYTPMSRRDLAINLICGILPVIPLGLCGHCAAASVLLPVIAAAVMTDYLKRRIGGYTGDCCGAACLICEVSMIFGTVILYGICVLF